MCSIIWGTKTTRRWPWKHAQLRTGARRGGNGCNAARRPPMSNPLTETALQQLTRKVNFIESGGYTQRMHCIPTIHPQSVAAHSFGVAWWCWLLTAGNPSANLLLAALAHDLPEHEVGD